MGTAESVAHYMAQQLTQAGHHVRLNCAFKADDFSQNAEEVTLICTSNTGMGDLPANIAPLFHHLKCDYPPISNCRYAIVNLGDSSYPNFAQAGYTLNEAMQDLGAKPLCEMLVIDAIYDSDPLEPAADWLPKFREAL